jgi:lipopolysaccharide export LptBFGC system permease protein LptF
MRRHIAARHLDDFNREFQVQIRIFPKYIAKLLLPYMALAAAVFTAVLFMNHFARLLTEAVKYGAPFGWVFFSMAQLAPSMLALSLPMSFQLAVLLTLGLLSERGELMALRAAGFSFRQISWPAGIAAILLCTLLLWLNNFASPAGYRRFADSSRAVQHNISKLNMEPRTIVQIGQWRFYADSVDQASGALGQVLLYRYPEPDDPNGWTLRITAPTGHYSMGNGFGLELFGGEMQRVDSNDAEKVVLADFKKYSVLIPLGAAAGQRNISLDEMSTPQIISGSGDPKLTEQRAAEYRLEAAMRLAMSFSPLMFFWISCPLAFSMTSRNRAAAMGVSILILFVFYGLTAASMALGRREHALAWWSPWMPDALGMLAGFFLWRRAARN